MSFKQDRKGTVPIASAAEEERQTFGRQSPYASDSTPVTQPESASSTVAAEAPSVRPSAHAAISNSVPQVQQEHSINPQEAPPPAYEEVIPRGPQIAYGDSALSDSFNPSSSAPLLGGPRATPYSTIPIPPAQPYSSDSSERPVDNPERARKFNKFWLIFFVVIVLLLIIDDDASGDEECAGKTRFSTNLTDIDLSSKINDFSVTSNGLISYVIVEQAEEDGLIPGATRLIIEASGADRDDVHAVGRVIRQDIEEGTLRVAITRASAAEEPECLRAIIRIILPPTIKRVRKLNFEVLEGNVTVDLLGTGQPLEVEELFSRVITGHSNIRAIVPSRIKLGGAVGTLKGEIVVGKELTANIVDGDVMLNILQRNTKVELQCKISVSNGNISVGLPLPYEGFFRVETINGKVDLLNPTPTTSLSHVSNTTIRGWSSAKGNKPIYPQSELRLETRTGKAVLSMGRIDL